VPDIWYQIRKKMQDRAVPARRGSGSAVNDEFDDTYGTIYGFIPRVIPCGRCGIA
jgi:hypothetical protein